jgi:hypothetical protein
MEYRNKWILLFLGIIITGVSGVFVVLHAYKTRPSTSREPLTEVTANLPVSDALIEVPVVIDGNDVLTDQEARLTMNITYPKIALAQHPAFAKEANDIIAAFVADIKSDFRKNVSEITPGDTSKDFTSDLTMRFTPLLLSPTIISIRFDASEYIAGAAHPNNHVQILNYDFAKHLLLSPTDLFASSTQALPFLSTYTRNALRMLFADMSEEELNLQMLPGTEPTHENFQEIGITKAGLTVLFNPYQVAAYARGVPEVRIPLADMSPPLQAQELISPDIAEAIRMATDNIVEAEPLN